MRKFRILIVDDSAEFLKAARELLLDLPQTADVACAASARVALEHVSVTRPDLVLMDMMMPRINGFEAMHALHRVDPTLRIFAVSLQDLPSSRNHALQCGAEGFIPKRYFATAIRELMATLAGSDGTRASIEAENEPSVGSREEIR